MITYSDVKNVKWANYANTKIDMEVNFGHLGEEYVGFLAVPDDSEPHGVELFNRAVAGDFGPVAAYTPPPNLTGEDAMTKIRIERQVLLNETDYIEMPTKWATLSEEEQAVWATYRTALRDLTDTYPNAEYHFDEQGNGYWVNFEWPTKPE